MKVITSIDDAQRLVGAELGVSDWLAIDQQRINTFADATGDHQWIHVDVEKAKQGRYSADMVARMPPGVLDKYFRVAGDGVEPAPQVRELIAFRFLNLLQDWPFKQKFDVIFCRNVLIYFEQDLQARIFSRFCSVLKPGGYLYIGHSERVSGPSVGDLRQVGITTYRHEPARERP